jgi:hypothetical protein
MSEYIHSKLVNGKTVLYLLLDDGSVYFESTPLNSCDAILAEGQRITRDIVDCL